MTNQSGNWSGLALANGRYVISARLGAGGMGSVYRALDRNLDADVVIKVPHRSMLETPGFAGRFAREIRSLVKLSHPRIVKVTDVGEWDEVPFAVMQFLPGGSLEDRQQTGPDGRGVPCDPREIPKWLIGVAQALDYVHSQGYIHRDVKPGNILFDGQGHSFLSDFGVAKVLSESADADSAHASVTGAGKILGTPEYMAPELIMGEEIDGRVDQYALAITVYQLLCGRRPFEATGEARTKVLVLHTTTPPPALSEWHPGLTSALSNAVLKGLAKAPGDRYPNCTALAAAVTAAVKELPARQDGRVRIKCPACAKVLSLPSTDFEKLARTGRRAQCPACGQPITVGGEAAGAARGGTMIVSTPDSGAVTQAQPGRDGTMIVSTPGPGAVAQAQPGRTGTMIVAPLDAGAVAPANPGRTGTMIVPNQNNTAAAIPPGATRTGTMIVDNAAGFPEGPAADGTGSGTLIMLEPVDTGEYLLADEDKNVRHVAVPLGPPLLPDRQEVETGPAISPQVWAGVAAAGGVVLVGLVAFFALVPRGDTKAKVASAPAPSETRAAPATDAPAAQGVTTLVQTPQTPSVTPTPAQANATGFPTPGPAPTADPSKNGLSFPGPTIARTLTPARPAGGGMPGTLTPPAPEAAMPGDDKGDTEADPIQADKVASPREEWSPAVAAKRPTRTKETLDTVLASAARFQNQLVIPEGMYCLEETLQTGPEGGVQVGVNQSRIELARNGTPSVRTLKAVDVEIEPKFADELREARRQESKREPLSACPAILTVWVTGSGECRIVRAEFLVRFQPRYNPNGIPDVDYYTLKITPEGASQEKAKDEDWETLPRMLNIKNVCERQLKNFKNMKQNIQQAQIDSQMNALFSNLMRSALTQSARDEAVLRRFRPNP